MKQAIYLLSLLSALLSSGMIHAGDRLSGDEIKDLFTNKTCNGVHFKLGPGKSYYGEDGQAISHSENGSQREGEWSVKGDKRCANLSGSNKCHFVERNDDGSYTLIHSKKGKRLVEFSSCEDGNLL